MSMKKILFTGFVPFLDNLVNPSKEILELIDDQDTYLLDVDYKKGMNSSCLSTHLNTIL